MRCTGGVTAKARATEMSSTPVLYSLPEVPSGDTKKSETLPADLKATDGRTASQQSSGFSGSSATCLRTTSSSLQCSRLCSSGR